MDKIFKYLKYLLNAYIIRSSLLVLLNKYGVLTLRNVKTFVFLDQSYFFVISRFVRVYNLFSIIFIN